MTPSFTLLILGGVSIQVLLNIYLSIYPRRERERQGKFYLKEKKNISNTNYADLNIIID